jgi:hypothetical protein
MLQTPLFGPEWLLRKALKNDITGRNWRPLAAKLTTAGSNVTVVAFGGSASTGFGLQQRSNNWISQLCDWLQAALKMCMCTRCEVPAASKECSGT